MQRPLSTASIEKLLLYFFFQSFQPSAQNTIVTMLSATKPLALLATILCLATLTAAARYPRTGLMNPDVSPDPCYTLDNRPAECRPDFENAALGRFVEASSTCGLEPEKYCKSTIDNEGKMNR